jgi:hypothetical protein
LLIYFPALFYFNKVGGACVPFKNEERGGADVLQQRSSELEYPSLMAGASWYLTHSHTTQKGCRERERAPSLDPAHTHTLLEALAERISSAGSRRVDEFLFFPSKWCGPLF